VTGDLTALSDETLLRAYEDIRSDLLAGSTKARLHRKIPQPAD
jgi:hypothetical protein